MRERSYICNTYNQILNPNLLPMKDKITNQAIVEAKCLKCGAQYTAFLSNGIITTCVRCKNKNPKKIGICQYIKSAGTIRTIPNYKS